MTIYTEYVTKNKLISPINGYVCKQINKQNIKQFGFESVRNLHEHYPNFPLRCIDIVENRRIDRLIAYQSNPRICPNCSGNIEYKKRNNKFCSRSCANSRSWSDSHKQNLSLTMKTIPIAGKCASRKKKLNSFHSKIVQCYCCSCDVHMTEGQYKRRSVKIFNCDKPECVAFTAKRIRSECGKISATKRAKRSSQEVELYKLLVPHFDRIGHNEPIANGWDADILLHDKKIAILWNGPWHYREMGFSNHSLSQVVNRDCIKIHEFELLGWQVLIYQDNHWDPKSALIDVLLVAGEGFEPPT